MHLRIPVSMLILSSRVIRIGGLRTFLHPAGRRHRGDDGFGRRGRRHRELYAPMTRQINLSSAPASNEHEPDSPPSLDSYLERHRTNNGGLTAEEIQSIRSALSNIDAAKDGDGPPQHVIFGSIESYISTSRRRAETGGRPIGNPGLYVRSILRNKLMEISEGDNPSHEGSNTSQQDVAGSSGPVDPALLALLEKNGVGPTDLNERCLLALSQCTKQIADDALDAYAKQKRRREMNGMDTISNPSSYIQAVLRNIIAESPAQSRQQLPSSPQDTSYNSQGSAETAESNTTTKRPAMPKESNGAPPPAESMQPESMRANWEEKTLVLNSHEVEKIEESAGGSARVTMEDRVTREYVDKCLHFLGKLDLPIRQLAGVGPKMEAAFHKVGIFTLRDLLWHFPRSYIDRSTINTLDAVPDGDVGTFLLTKTGIARSNSVTCTDDAGNNVDVIYFYGRSRQGTIMASNALKDLCRKDGPVIVSGRLKRSDESSGAKYELFNPDFVVPADQASSLGIDPVYSLSAGLTQKKVSGAVDEALGIAKELLNLIPESLSDDALAKLGWPKLADALVSSHKPSSMADTGLHSPARQRIAFEELSLQQAQLALSRWRLKYSSGVQSGEVYNSWRESPLVSEAVSSLPFQLSKSQEEALDELWQDAIVSDGRMLRLLNGDVGSGKTVLAYLIGLGCIESRRNGGRVVSILCPTQLLANQHVRTISRYAAQMQSLDVRVELLTGQVVGKARDSLFERIGSAKENEAIFLIGTHALTMPDVVERLSKLQSTVSEGTGVALAVVDEEQRFGVRQRQSFTHSAANQLYMSATPIPRSVSLAKSGLLDFTKLESTPRSVETTIVSADNVDKVLAVLKNKIDAGSKCFWVVPRISQTKVDDGDEANNVNVIDRYERLVSVIGGDRTFHVHGRMSENEREQQLASFSTSNGGSVLVGTTVIEVGIDIPDASILIVEDADRFGLSQLHQLRGRVGRSSSNMNCHCLLLSNVTATGDSDSVNSDSLTRLQILQRSNRGDEIADADLMLRGPGDMLGLSQSGLRAGKSVDPDAHWSLLQAASLFGRRFMHEPNERGTVEVMHKKEVPAASSNNTLVEILSESDGCTFFDETSISSSRGFALRVMLALFGDQNGDESNTLLEAISTLQELDASKTSDVSHDDSSIHSKLAAFCEERTRALQTASPRSYSNQEVEAPAVAVDTQTQERRLDFLGEDVVFLVLDVETTGLDDTSCHVIQLAAKVLGSEDEADLFSEYILPPIDSLPEKIEELTGITDQFLRCGGYDPALERELGPARDFRSVYHDFQAFCEQKAGGRPVVFVAHNAKFDIKMINGELRRWRHDADSAPTLGDTFATSLDTLQLFRERKWWRSFGSKPSLPRPDSFSLTALYSHVFNEDASNAHNAVGDIRNLERLLSSKQFYGWKDPANEIQVPFVKVES